MRECIEEGILQSYFDGELSPEVAKNVAAHLAACQTCAEALTEINNEMTMFAQAFEAERALDVPTVRLRERLDAAIAERIAPAQVTERKQGWSLGGWLASFGELFKVSPQRAIGFASLIAVIAFAAIFAAIYSRRSVDESKNGTEIAVNQPKPVPGPTVIPSTSNATSENDPTNKKTPTTPRGGGNNNPAPKRPAPKKPSKEGLVPQPDQLPQGELAVADANKPLPGEQNYLKAIDSLSAEIQASDVATMKPSLRSEYERNLAVLNQAIDSTRRAAPQSEGPGCSAVPLLLVPEQG